jgi:glycine cleavage system H protein
MGVPVELRYSVDHEWVRLDGRTVTIGITEYAQDALGDIVYVQPPTIGLLVKAGATIAEVESTKSVSDVYAPVSGTLTSFNSELEQSPELMNVDPYGRGWFCQIVLAEELNELNELNGTGGSGYEGLLDAAAYDALIGG